MANIFENRSSNQTGKIFLSQCLVNEGLEKFEPGNTYIYFGLDEGVRLLALTSRLLNVTLKQINWRHIQTGSLIFSIYFRYSWCTRYFKACFHINRTVACRIIFFCLKVIISNRLLGKQRNTLPHATIWFQKARLFIWRIFLIHL